MSMELVCPAGSLSALRQAVDHGADSVYLGFRDATSARNFSGLNFDDESLLEGIAYAHGRGKKVFLALNTYPKPDKLPAWKKAVDRALQAGADAIIVADLAILQYAAKTYPELQLHLSVQASATHAQAINFYSDHFGIRRAILPRVLSVEQIAEVVRNTQVEIEVFGFGSLCVMAEGRCSLSSYVTGQAPNNSGICSPASAVRWQQTSLGLESRLNNVLLNRYAEHEGRSYPTVCKARLEVAGDNYYAIEEPTSLNALALLPELMKAGVSAIKIEGRQRSPAYVAQVSKIWREAIDQCMNPAMGFLPDPAWMTGLEQIAEGQQYTPGAYHRSWK